MPAAAQSKPKKAESSYCRTTCRVRVAAGSGLGLFGAQKSGIIVDSGKRFHYSIKVLGSCVLNNMKGVAAARSYGVVGVFLLFFTTHDMFCRVVGLLSTWYILRKTSHLFGGGSSRLLAVEQAAKQAYLSVGAASGVPPLWYLVSWPSNVKMYQV